MSVDADCTWKRGGEGVGECQNMGQRDSFGTWCEVFFYFLMLENGLRTRSKRRGISAAHERGEMSEGQNRNQNCCLKCSW